MLEARRNWLSGPSIFLGNRTAFVFVLSLLSAEVCGWLLFTSDMVRAALVTAVLAPSCLVLAAGSRLAIPVKLLKANTGILVATLVYGALGFYGVVLGIVNRNGLYYILADVFHWYGEGLLAAVLTVAMLHDLPSPRMMQLMAMVGLVLGCVGMAGEVAGSMGVHLAGGHLVRAIHLWRIEIGRGFPTAYLVFVTAIVSMGRPRGLTKWTARIALLILLCLLWVTFKRSQWLTYACLLIGVLPPPRYQWLARGIGAALLTLAVAIMLSIPNGFELGKQQLMAALTYNPNYETEEALEGRGTQMESVWPWVLKKPMGYGFGAKIYVYTPSVDDTAMTHYVHNAYMYYAVQVGIPGTCLAVLLIGIVLFSLWLHFGRNPEWDWLAHGAFASILGLCVISMALVAFHTPVFGFALGTAALAIERVSSGGRKQEPLPTLFPAERQGRPGCEA